MRMMRMNGGVITVIGRLVQHSDAECMKNPVSRLLQLYVIDVGGLDILQQHVMLDEILTVANLSKK